MSLMSDEVNFLVYRYLQESGYQHSAFTFALESHISQSNINGSLVPSGALINIIQKGIQFIKGELCINEDGSLVDNLDTLESIPLIDAVIPEVLAERAETIYRLVSQKREAVKVSPKICNNIDVVESESNTIILEGHKNEVFSCCWHPSCKLIASGSADGIVGLWKLDSSSEIKMIKLDHHSNNMDRENTDITCLVWHPEGHVLATAASDFSIRIWDVEGNLLTVLVGHKDFILSMNWNKKGNILLSAGLDKKCILWDGEKFQKILEFNCHEGQVMDTDWQNDNTFASCSTDKTICVCTLNARAPLKVFDDHKGGVNCVQWDPTSTVLASCGDDKTIKLWDMSRDDVVTNLNGHTKEVTVIRWGSPKVLASASCDTSVRVWDTTSCLCLYTLTRHYEPVNSISFHSSGHFLVSGALDGLLNVWEMQKGECVFSQRCNGGVFEAKWSENSKYISICQSDKTIKLLSTRKILKS